MDDGYCHICRRPPNGQSPLYSITTCEMCDETVPLPTYQARWMGGDERGYQKRLRRHARWPCLFRRPRVPANARKTRAENLEAWRRLGIDPMRARDK